MTRDCDWCPYPDTCSYFGRCTFNRAAKPMNGEAAKPMKSATCGEERDFSGITHACALATGHEGAHTNGSASWGAHDWTDDTATASVPFCARCGVVQRSDGKNKPCRGTLPGLRGVGYEDEDAMRDLVASGGLPEAQVASIHRCRMCGTLWRKWFVDGTYSLIERTDPGKCCDNAPMGEQIEQLWPRIESLSVPRHADACEACAEASEEVIEKARRYAALPNIDRDSRRVLVDLLSETDAERVEWRGQVRTALDNLREEVARRERAEKAYDNLLTSWDDCRQRLRAVEREAFKWEEKYLNELVSPKTQTSAVPVGAEGATAGRDRHILTRLSVWLCDEREKVEPSSVRWQTLADVSDATLRFSYEAPAADAVDPHADSTGTPSPREATTSCNSLPDQDKETR